VAVNTDASAEYKNPVRIVPGQGETGAFRLRRKDSMKALIIFAKVFDDTSEEVSA
jgi:hypothetical protein